MEMATPQMIMDEAKMECGLVSEAFGDFFGEPPDVSCLMATYKGDAPNYLASALESIGIQSGVRLELILVVDGEVTNEIKSVIREYCESARHPGKIISISTNGGLARALNVGLRYCQSDLIARFDADDLSHPERLFTQLKFMKSNPDVAVLGTSLALIDEVGLEIGSKHYPVTHAAIRWIFFLRNPVAHPSVMFRKQNILSLGGYPDFRKSQDYALWGLCLVEGLQFANLPQELVLMRTGRGLTRRRGRELFKIEAEVLFFMRKAGAISYLQFLVAYFLRFISREFNTVRSNFNSISPE